MKKKKKALVSIITLSLILFSTAIAYPGGYYTCSIKCVGQDIQDNDTLWICLSDTASTPSFTEKWFKITDAVAKNKALAILLMAIDLERDVLVGVDLDTETMMAVYMYAQ